MIEVWVAHERKIRLVEIRIPRRYLVVARGDVVKLVVENRLDDHLKGDE